MKSLLVTLFLMLGLGILPVQAQGRPKPKDGPPANAVDLGDFLWQGTYFREAKAWQAKDVIIVHSQKDGTFKVPVTTAPTDLRRKLGIVDPPKPPLRMDVFPLFPTTEAILTAHYGAPIETGPSALTPASKVAVYELQGLRLTVHFLDGKAGMIVASRVAGKITEEESEALLARCGSKWVDQGGEFHRSAEGAIAIRMIATGMVTVQTPAFLEKKRK